MKINITLTTLCAISVAATASAQSLFPSVLPWKINTTGQTGYQGYLADVQSVRYGANYVYVASSGIPSYSIGPWPGNPGSPTVVNWSFRLPRNPILATNQTPVGGGHVGVFINGVTFYNPRDARSYNNLNIWHQNAVYFVGDDWDSALGHPFWDEYHHHQLPPSLPSGSATEHSPIVAYAFDGFPVYGPYAYANADGTGGIARMTTSYRTRNITQRTSLPNGTQLTPAQYGPEVSTTYPIGCYIEDFEYVAGLGTLDSSNGRTCTTLEYPNGTYAYFTSQNESGQNTYPYIIGLTYRGVLVTGNTGPGSGHNIPTEPVVTFCCGPCVQYSNLDRVVDGLDLATLLSTWGDGGGASDNNRDGRVDAHDLAMLLAAWGNCP